MSARDSKSDSWTPSSYDPKETDSFIKEQRQQVLEEEGANTAQDNFLNMLEHLDPSMTVIEDHRGFDGDIDCSILEKCNFKNITAISFSPGKITSISGIPMGVKNLACADNYLIDMPDFPDSIVYIDLHKNAIRTIGSLPADLKELNIEDNQLETLENLPTGLEILYCGNNNLRVLNLSGLENLRILKCSGNPRLVIEGLPDTLTDFQMDNDVGTQIQKASDDEERSDDLESKANYTECLHTFFELKKRYEDRNLKLKQSVYKSAKNKKAARVKISDLKPKCIECARPVGTIFKKDGRRYIAHCGDSKNPCSLAIELFTGEYSPITDMIGYYDRLTELIKQQIMIDKLKVLFHYITEKEGVELFKTNLDFYTEEKTHLAAIKKEYDDLYFNEERQEKVHTKLKKIQGIQERIKELFAKATADGSLDSRVIADAMTIYIEELIPEKENLQLIKYDTREILIHEKHSELFQMPWRLQQFEYTFGEYPRVIKFRMKKSNS